MRISIIVKMIVVMLCVMAVAMVFVHIQHVDKVQACTQSITQTVYVCP